MKRTVLLALLCGTVLASEFRMPDVERRGGAIILRMKHRTVVVHPSSGSPIPGPIVKQLSLDWQYPLPLPRDVTFDIHSAPTPNGPWLKIGETNQPPFPILVNKPMEFFRVETRNL